MRVNFCSFVVKIVTYIAVALRKKLCACVEFIMKQSIEISTMIPPLLSVYTLRLKKPKTCRCESTSQRYIVGRETCHVLIYFPST